MIKWCLNGASGSKKGSVIMLNSALNNLNINQLKIFESVYRLKSMTMAAQELFLTQSGVSQHIKSFEDSLEITLFVRNRSQLFATYEADQLYLTCLKAFTDISETLGNIKNPEHRNLEGVIRIGIPTEFGNNIVIPKLSQWSKKNPLVKFDLIYGYGTHLVQLLENGEIDLAFIDSLQKNKKLTSQVVFTENLNLVASADYLKDKNFNFKNKENLKQLLHLDFIEYEHKESILRMWFQWHYSKKNIGFSTKAWAMSVQGVAALLKQHMGAAVISDHLTQRLIKDGTSLHVFRGTKENLKNEISLAWLKDKPFGVAATALKDFFLAD